MSAQVDQLKVFTDGMKAYYKNLQNNIADTNNALPMFEDIIMNFDYSEILRKAVDNRNMSANFITGALVDTAHDIMAVQREFSIRSTSRYSYFIDSMSEYAKDSDYYSSFYAINLNLFNGTSPDQLGQ